MIRVRRTFGEQDDGWDLAKATGKPPNAGLYAQLAAWLGRQP